MATNKVVYAGRVLIDISDSTVTPETLPEGVIAYNAKGERIVGTMKAGSQITTTDDGNGNVAVNGLSAHVDDAGNVVVTGLTETLEDGNLTIGR